jgi:hypothetical protein
VSLASLRDRVEQELKELSEGVAEVERIMGKYQQSQDSDLLPAVAMNLQSFYTGVERVMVAVVLYCEQAVPEGQDWHRQLLRQMGQDDLVRPALISEDLLLDLDELRRFRHVVRSIYAFKLDPALLFPITQRLPQCYQLFRERCIQFLGQLTDWETQG